MESPNGVTGPINLGNPSEFSMRELAEKVLVETQATQSLVHAPLPADDPRQRQPDISLAHSQLGWEPHIALEVGLKPTVAYFADLVQNGLA
jgi:UDP-glucuronate decarboxylase